MELSTLVLVVAGVVVLLLLPFVLIGVALTGAVNSMCNPKLRLRPADKKLHRPRYAAAAEHHDWAKANGFAWEGAYLLRSPQEVFIACWRQPDSPRYFCIYTNEQTNYYDFVTRYTEDRSLTTSGSKDAHTLPFPPGKWVQSFDGEDHETLWERHREAEEYIARARDAKLASPREDFPEMVREAIHAQMEHVRSFAFWQVRGIGWYLFRGSKSGWTIEEQER